MRQLVQHLRTGAVEVAQLPDPQPADREAVVRTTWSLISPGTEQAISQIASSSLIGKARERPADVRRVIDKALQDGIAPTLAAVRARLDDFLTPGYSSAGVVEAVGAGVRDLAVGDRVGCVGANAACHAERIAIAEPLCIPLPGHLEDRWGAFGALGGIAAHGVRLGGVEAGATVAVIGLGLVGQLASQLVRVAGARALAFDLSAERVELARTLGAADGGVLERDDPEDLVRAATAGHGADVVIIAAATKSNDPIELAASIARDRASVVVVGDVGLDVPRTPFYDKELELRVSRSYGPGRYDPDYEQAGRDYPIGYVRWTERRLIRYFFEQVAAGTIDLAPLVTHEFPIDSGTAAYEALEEPNRLAILIRYDHEGERQGRSPVVTVAPRAPEARHGGHPRVALVGPGLFARSKLLPMIGKLNVELTGIAAHSPASAHSAAKRWGAHRTTTEPTELFDEETDVVVISTRHDSHAALTAVALERGMAVFVEKPLSIDRAGLDRVAPLLEAGGRLVVDFNRSVSPAATEAREHFKGRSDPIFVSYRVNAGALEAEHWLRDPAIGGGRLVGEGCHFIDFCSAIVGAPLESVAVQALGAGPLTLKDDSFAINLAYADGSAATVAYVATGDRRMPKERIEIMGAGRAATIDDFRAVELFDRGRRRAHGGRLGSRTDKGHAAILEAALAFFASGGEPPIPYARLLETTRATFAGRDALLDGTRGPVDLHG
jgi:predicted dehydrogenase/threonine dehydrogenase-like Zn-dependent dehydrogenase